MIKLKLINFLWVGRVKEVANIKPKPNISNPIFNEFPPIKNPFIDQTRKNIPNKRKFVRLFDSSFTVLNLLILPN
ncbi:hypothetical protein D3C86_1411040 [compost metagenome]